MARGPVLHRQKQSYRVLLLLLLWYHFFAFLPVFLSSSFFSVPFVIRVPKTYNVRSQNAPTRPGERRELCLGSGCNTADKQFRRIVTRNLNTLCSFKAIFCSVYSIINGTKSGVNTLGGIRPILPVWGYILSHRDRWHTGDHVQEIDFQHSRFLTAKIKI